MLEVVHQILASVDRHFWRFEDESWITLICRRCDHVSTFTHHAPHIYILAETIHHLQAVHGFPGAAGGWTGYLDALPDPQNPS